MNSVSWFIYIADVLGNLGVILATTAIVCATFCFACLVGQTFSEGDLSKECPNMWKHWWRCAWGAAIFGILTCFIPSKNTMYAIAASEIGQKVVQNEKVQGVADDAAKAIQQWIRSQIEPKTNKNKE